MGVGIKLKISELMNHSKPVHFGCFSIHSARLQFRKKGVLDEGSQGTRREVQGKVPPLQHGRGPTRSCRILAPKLTELPIRTLSMSVLRGHGQVCEEHALVLRLENGQSGLPGKDSWSRSIRRDARWPFNSTMKAGCQRTPAAKGPLSEGNLEGKESNGA
jgi:hypothetical protein